MDNLSPKLRSANMRAVKGRNTRPEKLVRRLLYALGYRFRLHSPSLPGKPDIIFPGRRKVIFVHGCFWHRHKCKRGLQRPKTNTAFWVKKLTGNAKRDAQNLTQLKDAG